MPNSKQEQLHVLIDELIALGEDREELHVWKELFPTLDTDIQDELLQNLSTERDELTDLKA